ELMDYLRRTSGEIRPVGSGHSFSALVPTDGHLVVIDQLHGLLNHDAGLMQATFAAGTRLGDIGAPLQRVGQAMLNLPDIDRQTLAGATATATHGTGIAFTCLSGFVTALRLITPSGEALDVSPSSNAELFAAARVSLGALGIVTQMTLQNRTPYKLKARNWVQPIEEVLETFDESAANHQHFEMFPLTHSDYALTLAIDETDEDINNPPPSPEDEAAFGEAMAFWATLPPKEPLPQINALAEQIGPTEAVDESYKILSNIRNGRFNEMEYSVPLEAGADCLREILRTIIDKEIDVVFPLEYRYVKRDDTWLSMSAGHEDHAAISIHRMAGEDFRPYFDLIEPIFWKYGGRPHWGKVHSLGKAQLERLYPKFRDFQALRAELDPAGRMLNPHLKKIFLG
ncbi:MAG: D-arabinono-1,4-lactone oxidase, partial [Pseudomonadales bacterium]|nr:D-arabinono-1,4-lactone oxidase [Pseudomonadales bacterium]